MSHRYRQSSSLTSTSCCVKEKENPKSIVTSFYDDNDQNIKCSNRIEMTGKEVVIGHQKKITLFYK